MKTAIITVKTEPALKRSVEEFARGTGMSMSDVVNLSLRQVIRLGKIVIEKPLIPNSRTAKKLRASLKDIKAGKKVINIINARTIRFKIILFFVTPLTIFFLLRNERKNPTTTITTDK